MQSSQPGPVLASPGKGPRRRAPRSPKPKAGPGRPSAGRRPASGERSPSRTPARTSSGRNGRRPPGRPRPPAPPKKRAWGWRAAGFLVRWSLTLALWVMVAGLAAVAWYAHDLPDVNAALEATRRPAIALLAADGSRLAEYGDLKGETVTVHQLPAALPQAVLATEDRHFYDHWGVDPRGLARALYVNLRAGAVVQGGSTITQQLAKNLFLTHERSFKRKAQELLLALWLETKFTKDQLLSLYLNRVYLGAGTYGVEAAAQKYFGKSARDVSVYEAAMLAGLLKAPSRYNPRANPDLAVTRADEVVDNLAEAGYLTPAQAQAVKAGRDVRTRIRRPGKYFADWVIDRVNDYVGHPAADLLVLTTLVPPEQAAAEQALVRTLDTDGAPKNANEGAVVVLGLDGAVRVMVGGRSHARSQYNRATQALRQPGSAFKPFVYLTALESGLGPGSMVLDAPITIGDWSPSNFSGRYRGRMTLAEALRKSVNTVAARLIQQTGVDAVIRTARRMGISSPLAEDASIALGTSEVTLLELTAAYLPFANGGYAVTPYGIQSIRTKQGDLLYQREGGGGIQVVGPRAVAAMNRMLERVVAAGTGHNAQLDGIPAGGKTGTSQDFRDAWFLGFTAQRAAGVWVGNDDNTPMKKVTGGSLPAGIWQQVMTAVQRGLPAQPLPGTQGPLPEGPPATPAPLTPQRATPLPPSTGPRDLRPSGSGLGTPPSSPAAAPRPLPPGGADSEVPPSLDREWLDMILEE